VPLQTLNPDLFPLIADASARYRAAQKDRAHRLEVIFELENTNQRLKAAAGAPAWYFIIQEMTIAVKSGMLAVERVLASRTARPRPPSSHGG